jgi:Ulp1 family protease
MTGARDILHTKLLCACVSVACSYHDDAPQQDHTVECGAFMLKNAELIMHTGSVAVDRTAMSTSKFSSYKQELCARIRSCKFMC